MDAVAQRMKEVPRPVITKAELRKLALVEDAEAQKKGLPEFKFSTNEEMLQAIGLTEAIR